jgi:flagellin FlaB
MRTSITQNKRRGMTGLETAIILVAFVIAASAFSFIVLNMGFLTSQKSQSVVTTGMADASSALQSDGDVIGTFEMNPDLDYWRARGINITLNPYLKNPYMKRCEFYIRLSQGRVPIDLSYNRTAVTFANPRISDVITMSGINETWSKLHQGAYFEEVIGNNNTLIEYGERWRVVIDFYRIADEHLLNRTEFFSGAYEKIRIDIRPSTGSVLSVVRIIPPINSEVIILE